MSLRRHRLFKAAKLAAKRLVGRELRIRKDVRLPTQDLGGWPCWVDGLPERPAVLSAGIGSDVGFERALVERYNALVHAFDPTPDAVEWMGRQAMGEGFHFHAWALSGEDATLRMFRRVNKQGKKSAMMWTMSEQASASDNAIDVKALTVRTAMAELGMPSLDILKLDIEGAEYPVLDGLAGLDTLPGQVLVEFHHRFPGIGKARTERTLAKLRRMGYQVFAISDTGRELSLVHEELLRPSVQS